MQLPEGFLDSARSIIDRALFLPAEERDEFLDANCGDDAELRKALQTLLDFSSIPPEVRTGGAGEFVLEPGLDDELAVGSRIGPYELTGVLGEGGMGTVFLAEQREPLRRTVALKLVKLGMDTRAVVARFEAERQTLALLDHPAIAKVHDAGSTVRGRPFFVMEYIDGPPLTEYCDRERLSVRERLELFVVVCRAVHHANHRGIIHRDIKPSNILVDTSVDPALPKIIDFGIAKAIEAESDGTTLLTQQGQIIGTPHYMSPERIQGLDQPGVGWDVYSLGVVYYQLLCGLLPMELPDSVSLVELLKCLAESDPGAPSTRLMQTDTDVQQSVTDARSVDQPSEYLRELKGDLDAIAMKAIETDPTRRYDSALQMAEDIERYLKGHTVQARFPSRSYRLGKLVRRHRTLFGSLAAIVLLSLFSAAAMAVLWQQQVRERERAEDTREYLEVLIGSTTDRSVLDGATLTVGKRFASDPEVEADLRLLIGRAYMSLGILDEAAANMSTALDFHRREGGAVVTQSEIASDLGSVRAAQEKYDEAFLLYEESLALRSEVFGRDSPETMEPLLALANLSLEAGTPERAAGLFRDASRLDPGLSTDQRTFFGQSMANLARVRAIAGQHAIADSICGTAVEALVKAADGDSLMIWSTPVRLWGDILIAMREFERAEAKYQWVARIFEAQGAADSGMYGLILGSIGSLQTTLGRYDEAESNLLEARSTFEHLAPRGLNMSSTLFHLGSLRLKQDQLQEALELYLEAEEIAFEEDDQIFGQWARNARGDCLVRLGRFEEATPLLEESAEFLISKGVLDEFDRAEVDRRLAAASDGLGGRPTP